MGTKILFYDDNGDLVFDIASCAVHDLDNEGNRGVRIFITDEVSIFIPTEIADDIIKALYESDRVDLSMYGPVVWLDEDGDYED